MARYIYQGQAQDGQGVLIQTATITVYLAGTTTAATVYEASAGGSSVGSVTSDSNGQFSFWVDTTEYALTQKFKVTVSKTNYQTITIDNIKIFPAADSEVILTDVSGKTVQDLFDGGHDVPIKPSKVFGGANNTSGHTVPNIADDTFAMLAATQTLTNKTLGSTTAPVVDFITKGPYIDPRAYGNDINAAVAAAAGKTVVVYDAQTLTASLTVPATVGLVIMPGGSIVKASTYTLTINGAFQAGAYQVFSGFSSGNVTFGASTVSVAIPDWWGVTWGSGATAGQKTSNTTALNSALACGIKSVFLSAIIYTDDTVTIQEGTHLYGHSYIKSGIFCNHATNPTITDTAAAAAADETQNYHIERLWLKSDSGDAAKLSPYQCKFIDNCFQASNGRGFYIPGHGYNRENFISRNYFYFCRYGIYAASSAAGSDKPADNYVHDNIFWGSTYQYIGIVWDDMSNMEFAGNHVYGAVYVGTFDFIDGDVNTGDDTITEASHGYKTGDLVYLTTTGTLPGGLATTFHYYVIRVDANTIKLAVTAWNASQGTAVDITSAAGGGTHTVNQAGCFLYGRAGLTTRIIKNHFPDISASGHSKVRLNMASDSSVELCSNSFAGGNGSNGEALVTAWNFVAGTDRAINFTGNVLESGTNSVSILSTDIGNTDGYDRSRIDFGRNTLNGSYDLNVLTVNMDVHDALKLTYRNSGTVDFYLSTDANYRPYAIFDGTANVTYHMLANSNALHGLTRWLDNRSAANNVTIGSSGAKTMVGHTTVAPGERVAIVFDATDDKYYVHQQ